LKSLLAALPIANRHSQLRAIVIGQSPIANESVARF
jgi:hypothetical protein